MPQLWARRRWRRLLNLIDNLPADSRFVEAQANDDELAEVLASQPDEDASPRVSEWGPVRAELTVIADRLGELIAVFIAANGGGQIRIPPRPRPVTAVDRAQSAARRAQHRDLVRRLLPHQEEG